MNTLQLNTILAREGLANSMISSIQNFFINRDKPTSQRGIYIYGAPGSGKTEFVVRTLKSAGYDIVKYDAGDIRNKSIIENLTKNHIPDVNIMSLWKMKQKKIVIVMDEIEGMNSGDKGGINALIKLLRPKKTKKQREEAHNYNPIVCIGSYHIDKKITELMKVCDTYELPIPTNEQIDILIDNLFKLPKNKTTPLLKEKINNYIDGDLRKLVVLSDAVKRGLVLDKYTLDNVLTSKSKNEDAKQIVHKLLNNEFPMNNHEFLINETDRTIVGLLWHENMIDVLQCQKREQAIPIYKELINNLCIGDYVDRITFQKQVWQLNELSSLIKTMNGNHIYHNAFDKKIEYNPSEVRFTRALTKYSTEYNNFSFLQTLCQKLGMDKSDLITYFLELKKMDTIDNETMIKLDIYDVSKLEIDRMFRLLDKGEVKQPRSRRNSSTDKHTSTTSTNANAATGPARRKSITPTKIKNAMKNKNKSKNI